MQDGTPCWMWLIRGKAGARGSLKGEPEPRNHPKVPERPPGFWLFGVQGSELACPKHLLHLMYGSYLGSEESTPAKSAAESLQGRHDLHSLVPALFSRAVVAIRGRIWIAILFTS